MMTIRLKTKQEKELEKKEKQKNYTRSSYLYRGYEYRGIIGSIDDDSEDFLYFSIATFSDGEPDYYIYQIVKNFYGSSKKKSMEFAESYIANMTDDDFGVNDDMEDRYFASFNVNMIGFGAALMLKCLYDESTLENMSREELDKVEEEFNRKEEEMKRRHEEEKRIKLELTPKKLKDDIIHNTSYSPPKPKAKNNKQLIMPEKITTYEYQNKSIEGYVYLLQSPSNAYKIGHTKNPKNRLRTFSVKLPFEVKYIALIKTNNMKYLERQLHNRFADKHINGEWFELSPDDVEYIKGLSND